MENQRLAYHTCAYPSRKATDAQIRQEIQYVLDRANMMGRLPDVITSIEADWLPPHDFHHPLIVKVYTKL
jgi:hypothetical protein